MGKPPKKKGGKKEAPKEEPSPSTETFEAPSTSEPPEAAEAEDDSGLTGAARKKKEKKEKKEKALQALQALQASRKPSTHSESTSRAESEVPVEQPSTAQSKGPSESSVEAQPPSEGPADVPLKKPEEPAHPKTEQKTEEEGDIGLGLTGTRKKKPRKKKADAPPTAGQGPSPQEVQPVTSELAAMSISGQQVSMPEPEKAMSPPPTEEKTSIQKAQDHPKRIECRYIIPSKIPGGKVRATAIKVLVNYLEMEFKSLQISRYDVTFAPDKPKKMLPEVFAKVKAKFFPKDLIAFDQMKNCYSLRPLKKVPDIDRFVTVVEVIDKNGKNMNFQVSLKATGVVDLENIRRYMVNRATSLCHPTEEVQCIDVILRQGALESYIKAGRQFFKRPLNPIDLGYGYEMWTGMFQSAIFTNKSFINVDVAHKGFPKHQKLIDALVKDFNLDPSKPLETQRGSEYFASFVKGLKVVAMMVGDTPSAGQRREYVCNALTSGSDVLTFNMTLTDKKEQKISVLNYFQQHKKYRLKYPTLNCLWVGNRDRSIFFPIELLEVAEGQAINRQLNEFQVSKMVREAATPPNERMKKITEVISDMKYSQNKDFKKFGLEISDKFYTVNAKVLEPPVLEIGTGKVRPRNGQWQANRLLKPEPLQSWGLIAVDTDSRNDYNSMIDILISTGTAMGMNVAKPKMVVVSAKMNTLHKLLMQAYEDVRLMFIIVSARGRDDYHRVKQLAEREVGILTQCVKEMTARRMNTMTAKNILLKVNSKLMGINQAIDTITMPRCLKEGGVMIVGADVTHPSPDQSNVPSIAAVTASMDAKCFIYNIELSIQTPKKEVIVEFGDMMCDHLKLYLDRNRVLPRKIFVFRDGVSEGQFAQVMNSELAAVHDAYARFAGPNKKPEVLFLLVQKRHHTRLFNQGGNMHYNVEPGTVVDTDIVHASELDFYLVSHQAIKGTARPTRYHAVCNDGKIPDDEVEQLTFYLCHLYSRCMRSVSYPTPTYYAHLACMRARSLTHGETFDNKALEKKPKRLRVLDKMLQFSRMFFV